MCAALVNGQGGMSSHIYRVHHHSLDRWSSQDGNNTVHRKSIDAHDHTILIKANTHYILQNTIDYTTV